MALLLLEFVKKRHCSNLRQTAVQLRAKFTHSALFQLELRKALVRYASAMRQTSPN